VANKKPNILMIMADQLPAYTVGGYGHPIVKTPNIDALCDTGVMFDSAYCNCPISAPSRASMCTGQFVSDVGTFDNGTDFLSSTPTFMHHLRRADYSVELAGKMHFIGPDQLHGFERRLTPEIYPSGFVWTPDWRKGAYHNPGTAVDQLKEAGLCTWSMQLDYDEEVTFRTLESLRDKARQSEDKPFFLCASYTHPHDPFTITQPWWDLYDHKEIDMPAVSGQALEDMHPFNQWLQIHHMVDVYPPDENLIRNTRHAFYGMISYFDHQVGLLVSELDRLGLRENTIVVVTSDHGEMLGEHGMWFKRTFFDPSVRVPLIFSGGDIAKGSRVQETVSLVDLFPTFLELGDLEGWQDVEAGVAGDSLGGLLHGKGDGWKDRAVVEYYSEGVYQPMRMAVGGGTKYVYVHDEAPLLFDLEKDPQELNNCIEDEDYSDQLDVLKDHVHAGWDAGEVKDRVMKSQQRRQVINEATAGGQQDVWDVQPHFDASEQYVRKMNAQETSRAQRVPRFEE
jgi:choline-sulfatase